MDEQILCPFCGKQPAKIQETVCHQLFDVFVCETEGCTAKQVHFDDDEKYRTRPIEDAHAETIRLLREENAYLKSAAHYAPASDDLIDVVSGALRLHKRSIGIRQYGPLVERARVLRDRCARMVKALEWYAQPGEFFVDAVKDYTNGGSTLSVFFDDNGERAREALKDGENG
jgi:hypothetical protein